MRLLVVLLTSFTLVAVALPMKSKAATVTCVVKKIDGATLILENCDERLTKNFQKGAKVKVRQQNKDR